MNSLYSFLPALLIGLASLNSCNGQVESGQSTTRFARPLIGGGCDGCELMYSGMPKQIYPVDTSAGWSEPGQQLILTGYVYKPDGKTPASNIILYYWQTDAKGYYSADTHVSKESARHGRIRGWLKTGKEGKYTLYTNRPGVYPDRSEPAHIHFAVKEPQLANEYYIDDLVFYDDPLLLPKLRLGSFENRGGSGILRVLVDGDVQVAEHDIILGLHIPGYPGTKTGKQF